MEYESKREAERGSMQIYNEKKCSEKHIFKSIKGERKRQREGEGAMGERKSKLIMKAEV